MAKQDISASQSPGRNHNKCGKKCGDWHEFPNRDPNTGDQYKMKQVQVKRRAAPKITAGVVNSVHPQKVYHGYNKIIIDGLPEPVSMLPRCLSRVKK
ncbi:13506_t:CDS:2 [Dentiscutata erythropus]|uniref:13506_t:CDS:1 n=1 Tax=Dentiscutata erythropus TaxID=1348616 RepID=A0A9N8YS74_9GLOM|nr:13506_t:CDS:2 [Dentiscutata erythropus]